MDEVAKSKHFEGKGMAVLVRIEGGQVCEPVVQVTGGSLRDELGECAQQG
jgi:hypothetical protein